MLSDLIIYIILALFFIYFMLIILILPITYYLVIYKQNNIKYALMGDPESVRPCPDLCSGLYKTERQDHSVYRSEHRDLV